MEDFFVSMLGLAAKASPIVADWIHSAVDSNPEHTISRRVKDIMPARARIHDVVDALESK